MFLFSNLATALSLVFCLMTLQRMLNGLWQRYLLLFAYICGIVIFLVAFWSFQFGLAKTTPEAVGYYYTVLLLTQSLSMAAAVHLYFRYSERYSAHRKEAIALAAVAIGGVTILGTYEFLITDWATKRGAAEYAPKLSRDLSFLSSLLTMALWLRILPAWRKERQLLTFAAGLGLSCSGDALSIALRLLEISWMDVAGRVVSYLLAILAPYLWYQAAKMGPPVPPAERVDSLPAQ